MLHPSDFDGAGHADVRSSPRDQLAVRRDACRSAHRSSSDCQDFSHPHILLYAWNPGRRPFPRLRDHAEPRAPPTTRARRHRPDWADGAHVFRFPGQGCRRNRGRTPGLADGADAARHFLRTVRHRVARQPVTPSGESRTEPLRRAPAARRNRRSVVVEAEREVYDCPRVCTGRETRLLPLSADRTGHAVDPGSGSPIGKHLGAEAENRVRRS